jgi:hypothetical protein
MKNLTKNCAVKLDTATAVINAIIGCNWCIVYDAQRRLVDPLNCLYMSALEKFYFHLKSIFSSLLINRVIPFSEYLPFIAEYSTTSYYLVLRYPNFEFYKYVNLNASDSLSKPN